MFATIRKVIHSTNSSDQPSARTRQSIPAKLICLLLLAAILPIRSQCQSLEIDSLKLLLLKRNTQHKQTEILFELSRAYFNVDIDHATRLASQAFTNANKSTDSLIIIKTGRLLSQALRRKGELDSTIVLLKKILPLALRHNLNTEINSILNGLGISYMHLARYDKALIYFFELLKQEDLSGDKFWESIVLSNIGLVYENLYDYDTALEYYKRSMILSNQIGDKLGMEVLYNNISICYAFKSNFSEARSFVDKAFKSCKGSCSDNLLQSLYFTLGTISFLEGNYFKAEINFGKSYYLNKKLKDSVFLLRNLAFLVRIYSHNRDKINAEKYLKEIIQLISEGTPYNDQVIQAYAAIISIFENSNDFQKLSFYQKKYISLKDSIFSQQLTTNLMRIEAEHLEKENKAKIESQNQILELNEQVMSRQRYVNLFAGCTAILLTGLALVLVRSIRQKHRLNRLLDKRVAERTHDLELSRNILQRSSDERGRFTKRVSAEVNQRVATIRGLCITGLRDTHHATQYLEKINATSDSLTSIISLLDNAEHLSQNSTV